ncbi:YsnF/AvaK domain-containing protein [Spirosoma spitsbergense]|uniref:YsnF/AvaK domain-containing protein n=1 Tax=Spirosoma spitsbergense TaxID=431554 RepID=UPI000363A0A2|nr:YsnF/AvaK domain-containing protein [Spirosoma spitsbergense]
MAQTVIGIFDNTSEAQQAVDQLVSNGFSRSQVDISAYTDTGTNTGVDATTEGSTRGALIPDRHTNTSGTTTEEVVDDTKDVGDSIGSFFSSLFGGSDEEDDRKKYSAVGSRSSIVTVHAETEDEAKRAADLLDDNGAVDVNERAAQHGYAGPAATGLSDVSHPTSDTDQTINVIEENLAVGKRTVETGGVRLKSRIVEMPVEESIRLRQERVRVERTPVNRPATEADLTAFQEGQIELREQAEVPVISKTAQVVEEISVGKDVTEREEVVRENVRRTEVDVENLVSPDKPLDTDRTTGHSGDVPSSTK